MPCSRTTAELSDPTRPILTPACSQRSSFSQPQIVGLPMRVFFGKSLPPPAQNLLDRARRLAGPTTRRWHHHLDQSYRPHLPHSRIHFPTWNTTHPFPDPGDTGQPLTRPRPGHAPTKTHPNPRPRSLHPRRTRLQRRRHRRRRAAAVLNRLGERRFPYREATAKRRHSPGTPLSS
ncbi:MAG: hypothetical protein QOE20_241 [Mycobacterium sp.]|jgi:hypothetical protein|nr:hypothetical protein [Mycobacterium sp.]